MNIRVKGQKTKLWWSGYPA